MCGITGYISKDQLSKEILENMAVSMMHRGPDNIGSCTYTANDPAKYIGLAHARLKIIDLSAAGDQPMFSEDKQLAIVFNGEIYNFLDLKKELAAKGYKFNNHTDTEVLINLYKEHGQFMLN